MPMPEEKDTKRLYVTLATATIEYLEVLSRRGTHGTSAPDVAKTFIEQGIRKQLSSGF
jgi:hypothetical protein